MRSSSAMPTSSATSCAGEGPLGTLARPLLPAGAGSSTRLSGLHALEVPCLVERLSLGDACGCVLDSDSTGPRRCEHGPWVKALYALGLSLRSRRFPW